MSDVWDFVRIFKTKEFGQVVVLWDGLVERRHEDPKAEVRIFFMEDGTFDLHSFARTFPDYSEVEKEGDSASLKFFDELTEEEAVKLIHAYNKMREFYLHVGDD